MIREKCDECSGKLVKKKVSFIIKGVNLGKFDAEVCTKCGERVFDEVTSDLMDKATKENDLWGSERKVKIKRVGDSLAFILPNKISKVLNLKEGSEAFAHTDGKKLVIEN